ncbi:MAG: hypothetical protein ACRCV0_02005 [Brevinema sp.]
MKFYPLLIILLFGACVKKENPQILTETLIDIKQSKEILDNTLELFFIQDNFVAHDIDGVEYKALYYQPISNQYFIGSMEIFDINSRPDIDTNHLDVTFPIEREYITLRSEEYHRIGAFYYAGDITPLKRFYTNQNSTPTTNYSMIKTLTPFQNTNFYDKDLFDNEKNVLDSTPVPFTHTNKYTGDYEYLYSNKQAIFYLNNYSNFIYMEDIKWQGYDIVY